MGKRVGQLSPEDRSLPEAKFQKFRTDADVEAAFSANGKVTHLSESHCRTSYDVAHRELASRAELAPASICPALVGAAGTVGVSTGS